MYAFADHFSKLGLVSVSPQYRLASAKTNTTGKVVASGGYAGGHLAASTAMFDFNEETDDLKISPAHNVRSDLPPTMTFHGTADPTTSFKCAQSAALMGVWVKRPS